LKGPESVTTGYFGASVAVTGKVVVVGAPSVTESGRAYVFDT
jgi:hypothetical protein